MRSVTEQTARRPRRWVATTITLVIVGLAAIGYGYFLAGVFALAGAYQ